MTMTKLEHAALEYLKALEGDEDQPDEMLDKAVDDLKAVATLWAQGYCIKQQEEKERVRVLLEAKRKEARRVFPGCEYLPGDLPPIGKIVYAGERRGEVVGEAREPEVGDNCRWWWQVKLDANPEYTTLQWPPTLTTKAPQ